jgi:putative ABC transport system permease protein
MKIGMFFQVALENMAQNKLRTSLTLLGLIVGISSVLLMTGLGRGFQQVNNEMLSRLLPNKLTVRQGFSLSSEPMPLSLRDAELLQSLVGRSAIQAVAPAANLWDLDVRGFDPEGQRPQLIATTADYPKTAVLTFTQGRFFTPEEEAAEELVVVVNEAFMSILAAGQSEPPTSVYIANRRFTIVGLLEETNTFGGFGFPMAYLPLKLLPHPIYSENLQLHQGSPVVDEIHVLTTDVNTVKQAQREIEMILRLAHGLRSAQENDFSIDADSNFLSVVQDSSQIFTLVLGGIGAISLVVGGIGIMNIMLATITERTREIGIRKAIGARDTDILWQFLIEAITICLIGALMGVALSYGLARLISMQFQSGTMSNFQIIIDLQSVMIASICGGVAGLVFGLYPALRAMRLDPIQALQAE